MQSIAFCIDEREVDLTQGRIVYLPFHLAKGGYHVDVLTSSPVVASKCQGLKHPNLKVFLYEGQETLWTMKERDKNAHKWIELHQDVKIPETDFHFYKMMGFDDYLWNLSQRIFPPVQKKYNIAIMPLPSHECPHNGPVDAFLTRCVYSFKESKTFIIGLQFEPIYMTATNYYDICDAFIVRDQAAKDWLLGESISESLVQIVNEPKCNFALSTIEDLWLWSYFKATPTKPDNLCITIYNHVKGREHLYSILEALQDVSYPVLLFLILMNYSVKDTHEQEIVNEIYGPEIEKYNTPVILVPVQQSTPVAMFSDVVIGSNYLLPLSYFKSYGKSVAIYNPWLWGRQVPEIPYLANPTELKTFFDSAWHKKQSLVNLQKAVKNLTTGG